MKLPNPEDILFGKGGRSNHHPGNKRYIGLIRSKQYDYLLLRSTEDKSLLMKEIMTKLCDDEGRTFVEWDKEDENWVPASQRKVREKIRTALCDSKLKNALKIGPAVFWPAAPSSSRASPSDDSSEGTTTHCMEELVANFNHYESFGKAAVGAEGGTQEDPVFEIGGEDHGDEFNMSEEGSYQEAMHDDMEEGDLNDLWAINLPEEAFQPRMNCGICFQPL